MERTVTKKDIWRKKSVVRPMMAIRQNSWMAGSKVRKPRRMQPNSASRCFVIGQPSLAKPIYKQKSGLKNAETYSLPDKL